MDERDLSESVPAYCLDYEENGMDLNGMPDAVYAGKYLCVDDGVDPL